MKKESQKVETNEILTSIVGLAFPRVSLFPGIKSRCTVKYIQDEHDEKRRKMDFQRARF